MIPRPGPVGHPARVLRDAAIDYALDIEAEQASPVDAWDRLRKAALRYAEAEKRKGRPRGRA